MASSTSPRTSVACHGGLGRPSAGSAASFRSGLLALVLLVAATAACGAPDPAADRATRTPAPGGTTVGGSASGGAGDEVEALFPGRRVVAQAAGDRIEIFERPDVATPRWTLDSPNPRGVPITFLVEREEPDWLYVDVPVRPNGSSGWVRRSQVAVSWTDHHLDLDLSDRVLTVRRRGHDAWTVAVAVGTAATPTPLGEFFLAELVELDDPTGPYGAFAFGLSAFSEALDQFNGGDPVIALHGTNHPDLIGQAVSNGCVRMSNGDVTRLAAEVPLGTPIRIVA